MIGWQGKVVKLMQPAQALNTSSAHPQNSQHVLPASFTMQLFTQLPACWSADPTLLLWSALLACYTGCNSVAPGPM